MARIDYIEKDTAPQEIADIFTKMEANGAPAGNLWKIAAHSPPTLVHLLRMGNALLTKTKLDPRLREMSILRSAVILDCEYERRGHAMFGKEVGMTEEQVQAIKGWENSGAFNETERAVLRFTDEVVKTSRATDTTFSNLAQHLEPGMMVELAITIGYYGMLARILLPFAVDLNDTIPTSPTQIIGNRPG